MTLPDRRAAGVAGAGVKTPAGLTLDELWQALLAGGPPSMSLFRHPDLPAGVSVVVAPVAGFDPLGYVEAREAARLDRIHLLAIGAADDALAAVADRPPPERCAVVCGVGYGAAGLIEEGHRLVGTKGLRGLSPFTVPLVMANSVGSQLAIRYGFEGPCLTVSTACASGADAIGQGLGLLRSGAADLVLAGGVDAMLTLPAVLGFYRTGALSRSDDPSRACRPFDRDRDGFVFGEGAGFVVLRPVDAGGSGPLGRVVGYAANCDAHHLVAPREDGLVAARCVGAALCDAGIGVGAIGHINAHATATLHNDRAEARVITTVFGADPPPVTAVKGATGHMIGGSGAVEAIVSLLALRQGLLPPTVGFSTADPDLGLDVVAETPRRVSAGYGISNSFGFGGHNAVLVLGAGA